MARDIPPAGADRDDAARTIRTTLSVERVEEHSSVWGPGLVKRQVAVTAGNQAQGVALEFTTSGELQPRIGDQVEVEVTWRGRLDDDREEARS